MSHRLLILNPGSTSTKAAVYDGERQTAMKNIVHTNQDLAPYPSLYDQLDYRVALVRGWLAQEGIDLSTLSAVVGRGGIIPNIVAGGYLVDDNLADCLRNYPVFDHASNLGGLMARAFAQPLGIPAYIYDAVTSDELVPEARVTGFKEVTRTSFCHVLNARATSHKYAETLGRRYEDMNLVVAHLGGGISISAHRHGRIIDSVSDDAGPFSPDRSGSLNMLYVVDLCYSGKYSKKDMLKKLRGEGGMSALLGTHDCREIERRIQEGDEWAALVYQAQALQIAKGVGIMLGCFTELIDAVILTGGLAREIALKNGIDPRRSASLLDIFSCVFQGLIPWAAQLLLAGSLAKISPLEITINNWYCMLLAVAGILAIILGLPRIKARSTEA